jgi:predicted dehydrogenase
MIRLGVIGYGRRIRHVLATIELFAAGTQVAAVFDPQAATLKRDYAEALQQATVYDDLDQMLDHGGLDGVLIGTRCALHTPYAVAVLKRHLPLFLEKPVAINWEQLDALREAAARSRSPVVVSFPLRLSGLCTTARELVDGGAIGAIQQVQAINNVPYGGGYYHGWMRNEAETGGLWLQKATHDFDYINSLVRQQPTTICAMESKTVFRGDMPVGLRCVDCDRQDECMESPYNLFYRRGQTPSVQPNEWSCSFAPDTGNHDSATAIIRYASGLHCVYTQNFYARRGAAARGARLIGYEGTIDFDWYRNEVVVHHHHTARVERHTFATGEEGHHGGDLELAREFLNILTGKAPSRAPLEAGLLSVEMCLMARDSCRTGAFVSAPSAVSAGLVTAGA